MKKNKEKFNNIVEKHPTWSSYVCFLSLVRGGKFSREDVNTMFEEFVDKKDYTTKSSKIGAIEYAYEQTEDGAKHLF